MPRPERPQRMDRPVHAQGSQVNAFMQIQGDIKALNSSVLLLSQKMQYLVRNEKILGRNLIVISKRLKEMEQQSMQGISNAAMPENLSAQLSDFSSKIESIGQKLLETQAELSELRDKTASREMVSEIKFVIDSIHPLEFVTQKQLSDALKKKK